ncbi:MAG: IS66 family transposase, partial [Nitrososphaera sp.]
MLEQRDYSQLFKELESYRNRCSQLESLAESQQEIIKQQDVRILELEAHSSLIEEEKRQLKTLSESLQDRITELEAENRSLKEQLRSMKETVSAVVARSVGAKPATKKKRHRKPGRKKGHIGKSRKRPEHADARVTIDQETCSICGKSTLSERPSPYTRVVTDIVPAKPVVTEYTVNRRYCSTCKKLVSPPVPGVLPKEVFGLRLMLLIVSLKLLGMPYEKISDHFRLLFNLQVVDATINHAVMKVAEAFGPRYNQLIDDLLKEKNVGGDETSWPVNGKNHWLWAFVGRWTVIYEVDQSRGKGVPARVLSGYAGTVTSDSWPAWNHVGGSHQKCLVHYLREIEEYTIRYKNPGKEFYAFGKKFRRILRDAIRSDEKYRKVKDRLKAKARLEQRVQALIAASYGEKNCLRLVKRLKREKGMLFTFLEKKECDWNNNAAERAIRPSVVVRKVTYGNKSLDGAKAHAVL